MQIIALILCVNAKQMDFLQPIALVASHMNILSIFQQEDLSNQYLSNKLKYQHRNNYLTHHDRLNQKRNNAC